MTDDDWIGIDDHGLLAAFSSEGLRPTRKDALRGADIARSVLERFAGALVLARRQGTLPSGGRFLPAVCLAESPEPFEAAAVQAPFFSVEGQHATVLESNFPEKRADELMMDATVATFDYDDKALHAVAAIAGLPTFSPAHDDDAAYVRYDAMADKTLRPYQQAVLAQARRADVAARPMRESDIPARLAARCTRVRGADFSAASRISVGGHADVAATLHRPVTPTGLMEASAAPRWPILLVIAGAAVIAAMVYFWF